jgi:hypothetical protein
MHPRRRATNSNTAACAAASSAPPVVRDARGRVVYPALCSPLLLEANNRVSSGRFEVGGGVPVAEVGAPFSVFRRRAQPPPPPPLDLAAVMQVR